MTITTHDCFAIFPKRCDKCNRLFWLEPYNIYYKEVGIEHYSLKQIKCGKHCGAKMEENDMCGETMTFPDTVEEFMERYKMVDREQVYSNGAEYVPIFRMKQWFDHAEMTVARDIEAPIKRGRWVEEPGMFMCSVCHDAWSTEDEEMIKGFNYCPWCGALMEEEG